MWRANRLCVGFRSSVYRAWGGSGAEHNGTQGLVTRVFGSGFCVGVFGGKVECFGIWDWAAIILLLGSPSYLRCATTSFCSFINFYLSVA